MPTQLRLSWGWVRVLATLKLGWKNFASKNVFGKKKFWIHPHHFWEPIISFQNCTSCSYRKLIYSKLSWTEIDIITEPVVRPDPTWPEKYMDGLDLTKPNIPTKTYQTKPTKPNLQNQTYQTKPTRPNFQIKLPNQAFKSYQTKPNIPKPTKPNGSQASQSLPWAWHSLAPACLH